MMNIWVSLVLLAQESLELDAVIRLEKIGDYEYVFW